MSRFTIIKGKALRAAIQIKAPGSTAPITLEATDTAIATVSTIGPLPEAVLSDIPLLNTDEQDRLEGKFILELTASQTELLNGSVGFVEDGAQPINSHKITIVANTAVLGSISAYIPSVYVINEG